VNNVVNTFDLNEEHLILQQNIYNDNFTNNWYTRFQNKIENWENQNNVALNEQFNNKVYMWNPYLNQSNNADLYEGTREEQVEDLDSFTNTTQNSLNNDIYEKYKSFFYRYQDYNQINRW
jgi:hypothetical protein